ncbi:VLRF1 family aeRF1-type release factor [Nonomuraea sp. NPDC050310]|uniref:VLRF1 family aeRF1-type release factor n=1 Tax=unclassified Nonomuraea TaxID=2593643 RepID=UPI003400E1B1
MQIDQTFLRDLVTMKDEVGVLSLYITVDPREESSTRPAWDIRLRNELSALREQVGAWPDKERRGAVLDRLDALEPDLLELTDAAESGIGRALFAAVVEDDVRKIALQVPMENSASLESTAYIRPLVTAMAMAAPAGFVVVSRDGLRLIDFRYGKAEDLEEARFDLDTSDWRPMRGPGPGGGSQPSSTQVDRFEARIEDNYKRWLHGVAPEIPRQAKEMGWTDVLLIGDPRLTELLAPALHPMTTVQVDTIVDPMSAPEVARHVADELEATRGRRDAELVARVMDAAKSGGKGALGLNQTLALLNEGRVEHLVLDENGKWTGARGLDGYLYEATPQGMATVPEPDLGERMIEAVLDSGATVTILGEQAAAPLAPEGGVGALLRW